MTAPPPAGATRLEPEHPRIPTRRRPSRWAGGVLAATAAGLVVLLVAALLVARTPSGGRGSAAPTGSRTASPAPRLTPPAIPVDGLYFGASVGKKRAGESTRVATAEFESAIGRTLGADRSYLLWDDELPGRTLLADRAAGRLPLLSIQPLLHGGQRLPWRAIADGDDDTRIREQADALRAFGAPLVLTFHHEPEDESREGEGSPADFRAAFRHYVQVFRAERATNVAFGLVLLSSTYRSDPGEWYPGDDVVDWIGVDAYNFAGCTPSVPQHWRTLEQAASAWYAFGSRHGKPLFIGEYGSWIEPGDPDRKVRWLQDAQRTLRSWTRVKAVAYFDHAGSCPWWVTSTPAFLTEFREFGASALANPTRFTPAPTPSPAGSAAP